MKQIAGFLFSSLLMAVIMAIFAISIAAATFIENDFGSATARTIVYNAHWFELLLLLGAVNLSGRIFTRKLYERSRLPVLVFHLSFVIILAGSAITRYTGFEGTIFIREGQQSDRFLTNQPHIQVNAKSADQAVTREFPVSFNAFGRNRFNKVILFNGKEYKLSCKSFIPNAVENIAPDLDGKAVARIVYADSTGRKSFVIASGDIESIGSITFAFDVQASDSQTVKLTSSGDSLTFSAPYNISLAQMGGESYATLESYLSHHFIPQQLYSFKNQIIVLDTYLSKGKLVAAPMPQTEGTTRDAMIMELADDLERMEFLVWGKGGYQGSPATLSFHDTEFVISYGSVYKNIPFELKLDDFILNRYPGSQSPSWFESRVTLSDTMHHLELKVRIYMNNILKYKGYRFYQSSYDPDEKGTVLSVNHDLGGTLVTYAGYLLMGLGMALGLFTSKSRFRILSKEINSLKASKKATTLLILLLALPGAIWAKDAAGSDNLLTVDKRHAQAFGKLLIQDYSGRIEPINTLSSEILRKLCRKSMYNELDADQVFLGMVSDPNTWQHEPLIRASHPQILEFMDSDSRYLSFASFFKDNHYVLQPFVEEAYRKRPAIRSKFDNEIIKLNERVNICYMVLSGEVLHVLPVPGDSTHTWCNHLEIQGKVNNEDSVIIENILSLYIQDVQKSMKTGDWKSPDQIINAIGAIQNRYSATVVPSPQKVRMEIFLNKTDIFAGISKYYGMIGFALLILQFTSLLYTRFNPKIPVVISSGLITILFVIHTAGLGMRWYVAGHAPWSNGYEALTYVAWATVLAGIIFASRSSITLSATSILAFFILHTAHLSWMDPQITQLMPVLKSYWLVIHVATITASYGFLFMGALLAFINFLLMIIQTRGNSANIQITIQELVKITEMSLIVGLYLLTIGAFLGGVWANESWGRYWGWDPKETWALVTILVYAFVLHMRMVTGLKSLFAFNLAALLSIGTVIMTYFGVNYYLSGLHSYAKGDPLPVPAFVYYSLAVILLTIALAYFRNSKIGTRE